MTIKIQLNQINHFSHSICCICGYMDLGLGDRVATAYRGHERIGNVCGGCINAGLSTFKDRLTTFAKAMRERVAFLEEMASEDFVVLNS